MADKNFEAMEQEQKDDTIYDWDAFSEDDIPKPKEKNGDEDKNSETAKKENFFVRSWRKAKDLAGKVNRKIPKPVKIVAKTVTAGAAVYGIATLINQLRGDDVVYEDDSQEEETYLLPEPEEFELEEKTEEEEVEE